jgi:spoIIIJ-associated protein
VKDRAFTGKDVKEAVRTAAMTLGIDEANLRYFVLDPGGEGRFGGDPNPARIAVLMDAPTGPKAAGSPDKSPAPTRSPDKSLAPQAAPRPRDLPPPAPEADDEDLDDDDLEVALARVMATLGEEAGFELRATLEEDADAVTLRLESSEPGFFLGKDGEGAPMKALEHVLHRMFASDVAPLKLRVEMAGYRDARDQALQGMATELAAEVRRTGAPRETPPLNAYERRIVHMAAAVAGGVASKSEGEGAERRVVLHPAPDVSSGGEVY